MWDRTNLRAETMETMVCEFGYLLFASVSLCQFLNEQDYHRSISIVAGAAALLKVNQEREVIDSIPVGS